MLALTEITPWHWGGFIAVILIFLALDLGVFHRKAHVIDFKEALLWTFVWFSVAMVFAGSLTQWRSKEESLEFITGYIIELSLSMDNVFVIAMIFSYFRVPLLVPASRSLLGNSRRAYYAWRDDRRRRGPGAKISIGCSMYSADF